MKRMKTNVHAGHHARAATSPFLRCAMIPMVTKRVHRTCTRAHTMPETMGPSRNVGDSPKRARNYSMPATAPRFRLPYYTPNDGIARWLSRGPLGEEAFFKNYLKHISESSLKAFRRQSLLPPYAIVLNSTIDSVDLFGLWVARDTPPSSDIATIVCQGGKAVPRLASWNNHNSPCVNRCMLSHERAHAKEANAQNACAGKTDGVAVVASTDSERVSSEINAYKRELKCLNAVKDSGIAEPPDEDGNYPKDCACRQGNLNSYLKTTTERLAAWEKTSPDDTSTWPQDDI